MSCIIPCKTSVVANTELGVPVIIHAYNVTAKFSISRLRSLAVFKILDKLTFYGRLKNKVLKSVLFWAFS